MVLTSRSSSANDHRITPGAIVLFEADGKARLGVVLANAGSKWTLRTDANDEIALPADRLSLVVDAPPLTTAEELLNFIDSARRRAKDIPLETAWQHAKGPASGDALAEQLFPQPDGAQRLTVRLALMADRLFFQRDRYTFTPRSAELVTKMKADAARRAERDQLLLELAANRGTIPAAASQLVRLLEDIAAERPDLTEEQYREAKEVMSALAGLLSIELTGPRPAQALQILDTLLLTSPRTNLAVFRYRPRREFGDEVMEGARSLVAEGRELYPAARDLTDEDVCTIDDASTKDIDDGISLRDEGGTIHLGVHIAHVATLLPVKHPLDKEAKKRATSVYLPEGTIPMLPREISEASCSLEPGKLRPVVSVLMKLDRQGVVTSWEIVTAKIRSRLRRTYDEVDRLLDGGDPTFSLLHEITSAAEARRLSAGAQQISKRDVSIKIAADGTIHLESFDEHAPARACVSELMVLANTIFAAYAARHRLPFFFRGQEGAEEEGEGSSPSGGSPRLKRSEVSLSPRRHAALGVSAYTQMTSPIRRYADLINQRQIVHHLTEGKPRYSESEMLQLLSDIEVPLARAGFLSKESKRFWLLSYLVQEQTRRGAYPIGATVVRNDMKLPLVELDDVFVRTPIKVERTVRVGDRLTVKITQIDPRLDQLRCEVITG